MCDYGTVIPIKKKTGTSLVVQWLRLCAPNAGGLGSIPGQGTRSHMPQLRARMPQLKTPHAATKTRRSQINKYLKKLKNENSGQ